MFCVACDIILLPQSCIIQWIKYNQQLVIIPQQQRLFEMVSIKPNDNSNPQSTIQTHTTFHSSYCTMQIMQSATVFTSFYFHVLLTELAIRFACSSNNPTLKYSIKQFLTRLKIGQTIEITERMDSSRSMFIMC